MSRDHDPPATADTNSTPRASKRSDGRRTTSRAGPTREPVRVARNPWPPSRLRDDGFTGGAMIAVTEDSTRDDLLVCVTHLNDQAKRELRYDGQGRPNPRWAKLHDDMEPIVAALLERDG